MAKSTAIAIGVFLVTALLGLDPPSAAAGQRSISCLGRLEPQDGIINLAGPSNGGGVIKSLGVSEGDWVEAGDRIALMDTYDLRRAEVQRLEAVLKNARRELERLNQKLQRLATIDGLTQVANRRQFDQQLDMEWRRMQRQQEPLALVLCDIDFFKRYNDSLGHQQGDTCLIQVARGLNKGLRRSADILARYGGEEFAAVLPNTPGEGALTVARNMQSQIRLLEMVHPDSPIADRVTISMGVAVCQPGNGDNPEKLIARADQALYQAKSQGRNQIFLADETMA